MLLCVVDVVVDGDVGFVGAGVVVGYCRRCWCVAVVDACVCLFQLGLVLPLMSLLVLVVAGCCRCCCCR